MINGISHNVSYSYGEMYTIQIYSGITSGRMLDGELLYTKILEVNLFAFAYRLFHEDFSSIDGALHDTQPFSQLYIYFNLVGILNG